MGITIGSLYVRRCAFIRASALRIWREFESFERLGAWLGRGHRLHVLEPRVGGKVEFSVEIDGVTHTFGGCVSSFEPARELTLEINWEGALAWPVATFWTIRLSPLYDGTLVELFHHGFERLGADAADELEGYEGGWDDKHLRALRAIVEQG